MRMQNIQEGMAGFRRWLQSPDAREPLHRWETLRIFQENWDLEAPDFAAMYDRSLDNPRTRRLWKADNYDPKGMMLRFIALEPEFVRTMFRDLFNEARDIEGRLDRFRYHCDELLAAWRERNPLAPQNRHFHDDDHRMASLYLALRYPERYAPHDFPTFTAALKALQARNVSPVPDMERFFKVMRTLHTLLAKDPEIMRLHRARLQEGVHYPGNSLLLAEEFCRFVAHRARP